ncbi:MAG: hypothetical protein BroJett042_30570 [Bacteroidota bacterium]|nr:MAG: hypothetical protein UZ12_BCD005001445 [Bacteroidetes bacterium OLB12]GIL24544.1 MAG: hypothetical protein BroJett042_30570 [Bacteroidota bacterium]HNR73534.1 hypothetical protein [Cyclobacteriaceae bacterium]HNU41799.1 hypothetical protein [Cyclobacteriaceae bacterium]
MRTAFGFIVLLLSCLKAESQVDDRQLLTEKILTVDSIRKNLGKFSKGNSIVIFKNKVFEKTYSFTETNGYTFKVLTEGYLMVGRVQYFLVFDEIEIKDSLASVSFHTSSQYLQENYQYIKASISFKKDKSSNWQIVDYKIREEECCKW